MAQGKQSRWYAFIQAKCPRCHYGDMFPSSNPYDFKHLGKMHERCPVCGQTYYPETGFYYGAMYMSYVMTVVFSAVSLVLIGVLSHWNMYTLIFGNAALLILGFPLFYRYARVLWLHVNVSFDFD